MKNSFRSGHLESKKNRVWETGLAPIPQDVSKVLLSQENSKIPLFMVHRIVPPVKIGDGIYFIRQIKYDFLKRFNQGLKYLQMTQK